MSFAGNHNPSPGSAATTTSGCVGGVPLDRIEERRSVHACRDVLRRTIGEMLSAPEPPRQARLERRFHWPRQHQAAPTLSESVDDVVADEGIALLFPDELTKQLLDRASAAPTRANLVARTSR